MLRRAVLRLNSLDSARLDAEILLAHVLGRPRSYLYTWPDAKPEPRETRQFLELVERRGNGEPVAYLTGTTEFWSMELLVSPDTLVPRPETETLVELALQQIPEFAKWQVADLGTGSGAIALAIGKEKPRCNVIATDGSPAALQVAKQNAVNNKLTQIQFVAGDWCCPLQNDCFHIIVSNPPYIAAGDPHLKGPGVKFEPQVALQSGPDGLDQIRRLIPQAFMALRPGGRLLLEHGYNQASAVTDLLANSGFCDITDYPDNAGNPRVAAGRRQS